MDTYLEFSKGRITLQDKGSDKHKFIMDLRDEGKTFHNLNELTSFLEIRRVERPWIDNEKKYVAI